MKYGYVNKFTTKSGKREELMTVLLKAAKVLETNSDCLQYLISTAGEPETLYVTEIWASKQAHDASLEPPGVKTVIAQAMPFIASVSNIAELQIEGGKGLN